MLVGRANAGGEPTGQRLPATSRLRRRGEFKRIQDSGWRFPSGSLILMLLPNDLGRRRLGVTVSARVGNAVVRARVKRWLRELFRRRRDQLPPSCDLVLVARAAAAESSLTKLGRDFDRVAEQARRRAGGESRP